EKLPGLPHLGYLVEVEVGGEDFVFVAAGLGDDLAARVAEVARAVELADVPGGLHAHAVDSADEVAVGHGVGRLLEFPKVFAQSGDGGGRIENDLRAGESQGPRPLGEVPVVANVDADADEGEIEDRVAEIAGAEVEFLPES